MQFLAFLCGSMVKCEYEKELLFSFFDLNYLAQNNSVKFAFLTIIGIF